MRLRVASVSVLALAFAFLLSGFAVGQDKKKDGIKEADTHEGVLVSVKGTKFTMKHKGEDAKEHSHTLAADGKVTSDGKAAKLEDLKPGVRIRVTTKPGDMSIATKVEALTKKKDAEKKEK